MNLNPEDAKERARFVCTANSGVEYEFTVPQHANVTFTADGGTLVEVILYIPPNDNASEEGTHGKSAADRN